jgi:putative transposase
MGIHEVLTAPKSPWQNPFAERLIGSIRRECLNHVIVLGQRHLKWILKNTSGTIWIPELIWPWRRTPRILGGFNYRRNIVEIPEVGGLHHRYERRAA